MNMDLDDFDKEAKIEGSESEQLESILSTNKSTSDEDSILRPPNDLDFNSFISEEKFERGCYMNKKKAKKSQELVTPKRYESLTEPGSMIDFVLRRYKVEIIVKRISYYMPYFYRCRNARSLFVPF